MKIWIIPLSKPEQSIHLQQLTKTPPFQKYGLDMAIPKDIPT